MTLELRCRRFRPETAAAASEASLLVIPVCPRSSSPPDGRRPLCLRLQMRRCLSRAEPGGDAETKGAPKALMRLQNTNPRCLKRVYNLVLPHPLCNQGAPVNPDHQHRISLFKYSCSKLKHEEIKISHEPFRFSLQKHTRVLFSSLLNLSEGFLTDGRVK